jgi:hypothetical protein
MKNMNLNADFLLDIWADLKAKKLAPVAIGLVVAAVAMPALMMKGEGAAVSGPVPIAAPAVADSARVEVAQDLAGGGSKLDSYKSRDPFEGAAKPEQSQAAGGGAATAPGDELAGSEKGLGALASALDSGSSGGSSGSTDPDSADGLNSGPGSDPNLGVAPPPVIVKRPGSRFNYQLDLRFGRPGREKRYPTVSRLSFLPSASLPALLFMGVPVDAKSALFFVHPGLSHQGEGTCIPSAKHCNFLKLAIGQEHYLSANDHEFHITLLDVNRVKLSDEKKQRAAARKASRGQRSSRGGGEGGAPGQPSDPAADEYEYPWLVDGIG